jgi:hypothetical protein
MTDTGQGQPPQGQPPAQGGAAPTTAELAARVDGIDTKVGGIDTKLDAILRVLPGSKPAAGGEGAPPPAAGAGPADVQSQVQAEIKKIRDQEAADARARGESDWRAKIEAAVGRIPETRPAEPQTGLRGAIQRALIGTPREQRDRRQPPAQPQQGGQQGQGQR